MSYDELRSLRRALRRVRVVASVEVGGRTVPISNADKVLFDDAGITKGELVAYYAAVAEVMLDHVRDRPLTLRRFPDGLAAGGFYQKEASGHFPDWIRRARVPKREGGVVHHPVVDEPAALVYLANQATIELHPWPSRAGALEHPDLLVIDLDPDEGTPLGVLRAAARALRELFTDVGLTPFVKTTGSRGYHVVAPLDASAHVEEVHALAAGLARVAAARDPDRLTVEWRKAKRRGRLLLDTGRNGYGQHAVAPYSVRALPGAPVAVPLDWDELSRVGPRDHDLASVLRRLSQKPDPWTGLRRHAASVAAARTRLEKLSDAHTPM